MDNLLEQKKRADKDPSLAWLVETEAKCRTTAVSQNTWPWRALHVRRTVWSSCLIQASAAQVACGENVMDSETIARHVTAAILPLLCLSHIKIPLWLWWVRCAVPARVQSCWFAGGTSQGWEFLPRIQQRSVHGQREVQLYVAARACRSPRCAATISGMRVKYNGSWESGKGWRK